MRVRLRRRLVAGLLGLGWLVLGWTHGGAQPAASATSAPAAPIRCNLTSIVLDWDEDTDWLKRNVARLPAVRLAVGQGSWLAPEAVPDTAWRTPEAFAAYLDALPADTALRRDFTLLLRVPLCNPTPAAQQWLIQGTHFDSLGVRFPYLNLAQAQGSEALAVDNPQRLNLTTGNLLEVSYFAFSIPPNTSDTLYLRLRTRTVFAARALRSDFMVQFLPLDDEQLSRIISARSWETLFAGAFFAMLVFNVLLLLWMREAAHGLYVLQMPSKWGLIVAGNLGLASYLFGESYLAGYVVPVYLRWAFQPLLWLFFRRFLELPTYARAWERRVYLGFGIWYALLHAYALYNHIDYFVFRGPQASNAFFPVFRFSLPATQVVFQLFVLYLSLAVWRRGHPSGWVLGVSQINLCLVALTHLYFNSNIADANRDYMYYINYSAAIAELLVFSMAFMIRFVQQRKALAEAAREKQRLLETENQRLELQVMERTEEIRSQSEELRAQNDQLNEANQHIADANRALTDSITYAQRLQASLLPSAAELAAVVPDYGLLYAPRDIVSGDFYWAAKRDDVHYLVVGDGTGHGVPGALMTVLALTLLHEEVHRPATPPQPGALIAAVDAKLQQALRQRSGGAQDGVDLAIAVWAGTGPIALLGAGRSMLVCRQGTWERIPPAREGIGGAHSRMQVQHPATLVPRSPGLRLCFYTDGITDQFGGSPPRKLVRRGLVRWLEETAHLPPAQQARTLGERLEAWQGSQRRLDDVSLLVWQP